MKISLEGFLGEPIGHVCAISRHPIIAITWHFSQQTILEPFIVSGARASCFGERYRDVLYQNLDENNNTQISTDCCTVVVLRTSTIQVQYGCVCCVCYMQFAGYANTVSSYVESNSVRLVADDDTTSDVSPTRRGGHEKTYGMRKRR